MPEGDGPRFLPCRIILWPSPDDVGHPSFRLERQAHPAKSSHGVGEEHRAKTRNHIVECILGESDFGIAALLEGDADGSPYAEVVQLNAAAALVAAGAVRTLADGVKQAFAALTEGRALSALQTLVAISRGAP